MQCGNGELRSGDKLLGASVVSPPLDLGCCSVGRIPNSAAVVRPGTAGQGCWTSACVFPWLGNQPIRDLQCYLWAKSWMPVRKVCRNNLCRQCRREKCGKGRISPFLLTELSLLWSRFPWELQSSGSAVLGTHPCHPPLRPRVSPALR